jgi:hypothetical protein
MAGTSPAMTEKAVHAFALFERRAQTARRANQQKSVKPLLKKYSPCRVGQISGLSPPVSPDKRGGSRSSRNARWDAVDAEVLLTNGTEADGEVAWF